MNDKLKSLTAHVLETGYLFSLSTVDDEGHWVADVIYTYDDELNIYWMSKPWRRHSKAIDENGSSVAGAIALTQGPDDPDMGLQLSGKASQVEEIPWSSVVRYFTKRKKPVPQSSEDFLGEHLWYKLVPSRIELIYQPEFGYERQTVIGVKP